MRWTRRTTTKKKYCGAAPDRLAGMKPDKRRMCLDINQSTTAANVSETHIWRALGSRVPWNSVVKYSFSSSDYCGNSPLSAAFDPDRLPLQNNLSRGDDCVDICLYPTIAATRSRVAEPRRASRRPYSPLLWRRTWALSQRKPLSASLSGSRPGVATRRAAQVAWLGLRASSRNSGADQSRLPQVRRSAGLACGGKSFKRRGSLMRVITVAGPPSVGKTSVIVKTAKPSQARGRSSPSSSSTRSRPRTTRSTPAPRYQWRSAFPATSAPTISLSAISTIASDGGGGPAPIS